MAIQHSSGDLIADRRFAYAEACLAEGDAAGAAEMAEQVLERAPRFAPAWALLGRAREGLHAAGAGDGAFHGALRAYANALALDPDDTFGTRLALAQLGQVEHGSAITPAYIRALFDGYAERFERHLVEGLSYRGPWLLAEALDALPQYPADALGQFEAGIDLGCGTGLVGEVLGERVRHLTGIDLSPLMLAKAEVKRRDGARVYDRLLQGELVPVLAAEPASSVDLVVAADVFIYVGDLTAVLAGVARVLRPGGLVAFTVQGHEDPSVPVVLGEDARYSQSPAHLAQAGAAAGLDSVSLRPAVIRRERGVDVLGLVAVLRR